MSSIHTMVSWAKGANIYEVNIRQYTPEGTFEAFSKHLPRLKNMGVEILWLMPITPISLKVRQGTLGSYYACSSYTTINPEFGSISDFKKMVDEAHALGFKIIIDWVANHTGWDHHWTLEHPDWYVQDKQGNFTERNGWHDVIDLNFESKEMRKALIDAMKFWVNNADIDGFRCDMAHLVPLDFWVDARKACDQLKPLFWLAECEVVDYHQVYDVSYAWAFMHETEKFEKGELSLNHVRQVLHAYSQYPPGAAKLFFTTNHDENSWNGTEFEKYGNNVQAWAVFTCTWQGIPLVYSGQELPNTKRLQFFNKDCIDWQEPLKLQDFYTKLLKLRKSSAALQSGETFILPEENGNRLMAFLRRSGEDTVLVILNLSPDNRIKIDVKHPWLTGNFVNLFSELQHHFKGEESFEIQAGEYLVYFKK